MSHILSKLKDMTMTKLIYEKNFIAFVCFDSKNLQNIIMLTTLFIGSMCYQNIDMTWCSFELSLFMWFHFKMSWKWKKKNNHLYYRILVWPLFFKCGIREKEMLSIPIFFFFFLKVSRKLNNRNLRNSLVYWHIIFYLP